MEGGATRNKRLGIFAGIYLALMALALSPAIWSALQTWIPTTATVESTAIERSRPGTPAWSLIVKFSYPVKGETFSKDHFDVFHRTERSDTEAEQTQWPSDKEFTIYYSEKNPESVSLDANGDLQGLTVMSVLFGGMVTVTAIPFFIAVRRTSKE